MITRRERAIEVLQGKTGDIVDREYFEAIANETLPQYFLDRFQWYKLYSDDLPGERLVDIWHPDFPMMKCRGSIIFGISGELTTAVKDKVIKSNEIIGMVKYYKKYDWNFQKEAKGEYWTSSEEIDLINNTLEAVIKHLNQEYKLEDNIDSIKQEFQKVLIQRRQGLDVRAVGSEPVGNAGLVK